jgi:hypothetical protein
MFIFIIKVVPNVYALFIRLIIGVTWWRSKGANAPPLFFLPKNSYFAY